MQKKKKLNNDLNNVQLEWYEAIMASMITFSLFDLTRKPPKLKQDIVNLYYLYHTYYPVCREIRKNHDDADYFFNSKDSLINKYYAFDKGSLTKYYERKYRKQNSKQSEYQRLFK